MTPCPAGFCGSVGLNHRRVGDGGRMVSVLRCFRKNYRRQTIKSMRYEQFDSI
jgi:hypothetical protein